MAPAKSRGYSRQALDRGTFDLRAVRREAMVKVVERVLLERSVVFGDIQRMKKDLDAFELRQRPGLVELRPIRRLDQRAVLVKVLSRRHVLDAVSEDVNRKHRES